MLSSFSPAVTIFFFSFISIPNSYIHYSRSISDTSQHGGRIHAQKSGQARKMPNQKLGEDEISL